MAYWYKRLGTKDYSVKLDEMFKETGQLLSCFPQLVRQLENPDEHVFVKDHYKIFYLDEEKAIKIFICGIVVEIRRNWIFKGSAC